LIFLERLGQKISLKGLDAVTTEAKAMVYNRMCPDGGWNYGNAQVLGEGLHPYPLTTALALIALQQHCLRLENQKSLHYLQKVLPSEKSALAICYASLCLDIYSLPWHGLLDALVDLYDKTLFFQSINTCALALLVLQAKQGRNIYRSEENLASSAASSLANFG
jgi:hypothetical protein